MENQPKTTITRHAHANDDEAWEAAVRRYNERVRELLDGEHTINPGTMSGTQGEIARIDFTEGTTVLRLTLESWHDHDWEHKRRDEYGYQIVEALHTADDDTAGRRGRTLWEQRALAVTREIHSYNL